MRNRSVSPAPRPAPMFWFPSIAAMRPLLLTCAAVSLISSVELYVREIPDATEFALCAAMPSTFTLAELLLNAPVTKASPVQRLVTSALNGDATPYDAD